MITADENLNRGKWLLNEKVTRLLARKIAKFTLDKLKNTAPINNTYILAVSHVPPIMSFLRHTMAYDRGKAAIDEEIKSELFSSFGGNFVGPLDGFEIKYDTDNKDSLSVVFEKHDIHIPISFLQEMYTAEIK